MREHYNEAIVEELSGPGNEHRIRCGNPDCTTREHGRPLARPNIICHIITGNLITAFMVSCTRCGEYSKVKVE